MSQSSNALSHLKSSATCAGSLNCTTTVYEVFRKCNFTLLAKYLFQSQHALKECKCNQSAPFQAVSPECDDRLNLFTLYVKACVTAIMSVEPNLKASVSKPLDVLDVDAMEAFRAASWPYALGMRVNMPDNTSSAQYAFLSAVLLSHLCSM